jgi:hypothetical protein
MKSFKSVGVAALAVALLSAGSAQAQTYSKRKIGSFGTCYGSLWLLAPNGEVAKDCVVKTSSGNNTLFNIIGILTQYGTIPSSGPTFQYTTSWWSPTATQPMVLDKTGGSPKGFFADNTLLSTVAGATGHVLFKAGVKAGPWEVPSQLKERGGPWGLMLSRGGVAYEAYRQLGIPGDGQFKYDNAVVVNGVATLVPDLPDSRCALPQAINDKGHMLSKCFSNYQFVGFRIWNGTAWSEEHAVPAGAAEPTTSGVALTNADDVVFGNLIWRAGQTSPLASALDIGANDDVFLKGGKLWRNGTVIDLKKAAGLSSAQTITSIRAGNAKGQLLITVSAILTTDVYVLTPN